MSVPLIHVVSTDETGERLDRLLTQIFPSHSRSRFAQWIRGGRVRVNGTAIKASYRVKAGDHIEVTTGETGVVTKIEPEPIPLAIIYEDDYLVAIDKPAGRVVHQGAGVHSGTLVNALLYHCQRLSSLGGVCRPGIVHRLDKGTSGVLLAAKDDETHRRLAAAFQERRVTKHYLALVRGAPAQVPWRIDLPLGRHIHDRHRMSTHTKRGRPAVTHIIAAERLGEYSFLHLLLETGRTHQVRVHLAALGMPVVADPTYGSRRKNRSAIPAAWWESLGGPALHAWQLLLEHPIDGRRLCLTAPLRPALVSILEELRNRQKP